MSGIDKVLITGSAGRIGRAAAQALGADAVRGFDRVPSPGLTDFVVGDLNDPQAIARAVKGVSCIVHLAATPDDDVFETQLMPNNILGVYHLLEAARAAGVQRLILASSGQVVWWQRMHGPLPIDDQVQPTPKSWYAATKMFLEAAGRSFAEMHGMSVIIVRFGWCPRTVEQVEEIRTTAWAQDVYLSPRDAGRFCACAARAPSELRFAVVYATSKPVTSGPYDLETARRLLGYVPEERWPQGIEIVTEHLR